jgi:hypothetical protein
MRLLALLGLVMLAGCGGDEDSAPAVVRAGSQTLQMDELKALAGSADLDVVARQWAEEQIIGEMGLEHAGGSDPDIERQVQQIRSRLYAHKMEESLLSERLDTTVSDTLISTYYHQHPEEFRLDDYLVNVLFARFARSDDQARKFEQFFWMSDSVSLEKAADAAKMFAEQFVFNGEEWMYFEEVLRMLPPESIYSRAGFVTGKRRQKFEDENFIYFIRVLDFRQGQSPLEFERNNIRKQILQTRMMELRKQIRWDIIEKAYENGDIEISL